MPWKAAGEAPEEARRGGQAVSLRSSEERCAGRTACTRRRGGSGEIDSNKACGTERALAIVAR